MGKTNSREIEMQINSASSVALFPYKVQKQGFRPAGSAGCLCTSVVSGRLFAYQGIYQVQPIAIQGFFKQMAIA